MTSRCTICQVPGHHIADSEILTYQGKPLRVDNLLFLECPECQEHFCPPELIQYNDKKIRQAKHDADKQASLRGTFQERVAPWMETCFGAKITNDPHERNLRFIEEALELVQSLELSKEAAHFMVDYVYSREKGDPPQEVAGTIISLAALCIAHHIDMQAEGDKELARIWPLADKIRERQKTKPRP